MNAPADIWRTHTAYEQTACLGSLRFTVTEGAVWSAECDTCPARVGIPRGHVDAEFRIQRLLDASGLPERFAGKPLTQHEGTVEAIRAIAGLVEQWDTPERPRPPMLFGDFGRGKTHLLCRAADKLIREREVPLRYCTFSDLLEAAKLAMDTPGASSTAVFHDAASVELLVLDDLGAGLSLKSDWQVNALEQLIDSRYRGRPREHRALPIMGATNVHPKDWAARFGPRAASRLTELCAPVAVTGRDWRTG